MAIEIDNGFETVMNINYNDYSIGFTQGVLELLQDYDRNIDNGLLLKIARFCTQNNDGESYFELCDGLRIRGEECRYLCDNQRGNITVITSEELES